ncbi:uncharacterized protein LOC118186692 isoform X1 [Stegodyphus dumicola]|uniref:uncharacterized protein LOC118186692 isoform X1 n=2 Tax=Stegodyphus dumicola TaxID=202533 RepID=UPI0015A92497|nr:uncharacterized protein LOC118186692 isoform X1 [Stegodyphus dumicola]
MSTNISPKFSAYLGKYKTMDPSQMQMLLTCFGMWMNIQQQKIQVSLLQKKLNDILVVYMKRRKCHLMQMVDYNIKKLKQMIEYTHSPQQFYELFHVSLPAFLRMRDILYKQDLEPSGWIPEIELLLFLFWLSSGSSFRKTSSFCGISVPSLNKIFQDIFNKFLANLSNVIQFQKTDTEYLCAGFQKLTSCHIFGLVMGCLDTYHVPINLKSKDKHYINNTQNTSIQVQVVCDYNGAFIDIAIGFPGGMLKSHVLQCTPLYLEALMPAKGFVLLSGSGFPCLQQPICLIPPFSNADDPVKERFNSCQQKVHSVIKKKYRSDA